MKMVSGFDKSSLFFLWRFFVVLKSAHHFHDFVAKPGDESHVGAGILRHDPLMYYSKGRSSDSYVIRLIYIFEVYFQLHFPISPVALIFAFDVFLGRGSQYIIKAQGKQEKTEYCESRHSCLL